MEEWEFIVEGYSRGSALATLTALYLKHNLSYCNVTVFTYSTMRIFDKEGAISYEKILGQSHHSFLCLEDPFHRYLGPSVCGFQATPQNPILFKATGTVYYDERVSKKAYSNFPPHLKYFSQLPIIRWFFQKIIPPIWWEAHMPQTYNTLVPHIKWD